MRRERRGRLAAASPPSSHVQPVGGSSSSSSSSSSRRAGRRGRPRTSAGKNLSESGERGERSARAGAAGQSDTHTGPPAFGADGGASENGSHPSGSGRLSTAFCRLCHGRFSPRSLRSAFGGPHEEPAERAGEKGAKPPLFCADFQRLVGVPVSQDPLLSRFVCKSCHEQFYRCHGILLDFLHRVNLSPSACETPGDRANSLWSPPTEDRSLSALITSSPQCLHNLVSWAHHHAGACNSCPGLQKVLEGNYRGMVKAVWGCVDGHSYVVEAHVHPGPGPSEPTTMVRPERDELSWRSGAPKPGVVLTGTEPPLAPSSPAAAPPTQSPSLNPTTTASTTDTTEGTARSEETVTPVAVEPLDGVGDSDLSDRDFSSEEEEDRRKSGSSDELFEPYPGKRGIVSSKKTSREPEGALEPKVRKKPGPKPGWKKKIKSEREELPNIYKCPHQGCTAVYRGADGMKKHIKEHHEEVRERPCPHPGCNKVFMIDRYLQRHVKLIHTEVRNYICDQCGQTFKQRKHLSVHQMRHSGAKPLQCEVCGFQCRQRASLKYHMTKHKAEAELEFACELCGKRFEKAHNLNVHMSMVHPLTQGGSGPDPSPQGTGGSRPQGQQSTSS